MPRAWDDGQRGGEPTDGWDDAPADGPAAEELAHEIALAAALDRSRRDLSPDPHASARMRNRLFEVLAQEGVGSAATGAPEETQEAPRGRAPRSGDRTPMAPGDLTAPIGPPIAEDLDHTAASNRRSAGEHAPESDDPGSSSGRSRGRRPRHVLPSDHPDHPGQTVGAAGGAEDRSGPGRDGDGDGRPGPRMLDRRRPSVRKRFGIVVGGFAALAVVTGVTSTVSQNALPGDAMYGVKRASEGVGGVFTMGGQAEAARQLDLARSRVDEVENLMARSSSPSPDTITGSLDDFDRATSTGARLMLSGSGTDGADPARLAELRTWAAAQSGRLSAIEEDLPAASRPEAAEAVRLLDRVLARAEALRATSGCATDGGGSVDDLGPLPGECRTGTSGPEAVKQSGTPTPEEPTTPSGSESPSSSPESSDSSSPQTSTSESEDTDSSEPGPGLPLLGDQSTSSSPSSDGSSSTTSDQEERAPLVTIPPLLPGLGPVSIG